MRHRPTRTLLALVAAALLVLAACGDDDDGLPDGDTAPPAEGPTTATGGVDEGDEADPPAGGTLPPAGDGDPAFCADMAGALEVFDDLADSTGEAPTDPEALGQALAVLEAVRAPEEIRQEWELLVGSFVVYASAMAEVDPDDPESMEELATAMEALQADQQDYEDAIDTVDGYLTDRCGLDLDD
jgi:hypothetical protein